MNPYKTIFFFETSAPARAGHYLVYTVYARFWVLKLDADLPESFGRILECKK